MGSGSSKMIHRRIIQEILNVSELINNDKFSLANHNKPLLICKTVQNKPSLCEELCGQVILIYILFTFCIYLFDTGEDFLFMSVDNLESDYDSEDDRGE